ncbi:hypothetical protein ACOMHN_063714 [Nucella lapillus]
MPSVDCYTDHRLVRAKLRLAIKPPMKGKGPQAKKLQIDRLHECKEELQNKLGERLKSIKDSSNEEDTDPEIQLQQLKTILQETTAEVAGFTTRKNRNWFDEKDTKIQDLIQKKRSCHEINLARPDDQAVKAAYRSTCNTAQSKLREMQNKWWIALVEQTQL